MSTASDVLTPVLKNLGGRTDNDTIAICIRNINLAQKILAVIDMYPELETSLPYTLTLDDHEYSFSDFGFTRMRKIQSINLDSSTSWTGRKLGYITLDKWENTVAPTLAMVGSQKPKAYTIWGKNVLLDTKPDQAYTLTIRYKQWPVNVVQTTDILTLEDAEDALVTLVTAFSWLSLEEFDSASPWLKLAGEYVKGMGAEQLAEGQILSLHREIETTGRVNGNYWQNPFIKENP